MVNIVPSLFIFFFHLINNWPRLAFYIMEHSTGSGGNHIKISWSRPHTKLANTVDDFHKLYGQTNISVCKNLPLTWINTTVEGYFWKIEDDYGTLQYQEETVACKITWIAPRQTIYMVSVTVRRIDGEELNGYSLITVEDYWIAVIGDSYASGEGNPDHSANANKPAQWLSERCHRSRRSWPYKTYEKIVNASSSHAVHLTYLPCTGASVDNGILLSTNGSSQIEALQKIAQRRGSGPDLLMMSIGGNDIGYSEILSTLIGGGTSSLFSTIDMRFFYTSHQLDRVANALKEIKPKQVIIPYYFDLTRNEHGVVDANCAEMRQISTENLMLAERKILQRINKLISKKSKQYGWTSIDGITELFRSRGYCSSRSLIRNVRDSVALQGNSLGAFHPTEEAHEEIAKMAFQKLKVFET